ncbi:MAG: threonine/serine exporter family protein [Pasteurellaceae bacterium]|nr:threonine/serine exporter family protein [Pasteurellaceae bacterium]
MQNTDEKQREITRLCSKVALLLLQYGAESMLVVETTQRLGIALGANSVEIALTPNAIVLTTLVNGNFLTTTRKNQDRGINMQMVTAVQHIVITAEHQVYDIRYVRQKLEQLHPFQYNRYLVMLMVGLSCASFAHLSGGDRLICLITFFASSIAMFIRQTLTKRAFNSIIVFPTTAFVASIIAGISLKYQLGNHPQIALASSVLLLVPGFPLINALADILKGHINMGIARWVIASVLTFGACIGIAFALILLHLENWGA